MKRAGSCLLHANLVSDGEWRIDLRIALALIALLTACGGTEGGLQLRPDPMALLSIEGPSRVAPGESAVFKAVLRTYPDQQVRDVTQEAVWSSSNPAVLSIDRGVAKGLVAGSTNLEFQYSGRRSSPRPVFVGDPNPGPQRPPAREIAVGEVVQGTISQNEPTFEFQVTAPVDGTLVARLTWDVEANGTLLLLVVDQTSFPARPAEWSPIVGRVAVSAGRPYRITVSLAGSDWIPNDRFTLTTAIE